LKLAILKFLFNHAAFYVAKHGFDLKKITESHPDIPNPEIVVDNSELEIRKELVFNLKSV